MDDPWQSSSSPWDASPPKTNLSLDKKDDLPTWDSNPSTSPPSRSTANDDDGWGGGGGWGGGDTLDAGWGGSVDVVDDPQERAEDEAQELDASSDERGLEVESEVEQEQEDGSIEDVDLANPEPVAQDAGVHFEAFGDQTSPNPSPSPPSRSSHSSSTLPQPEIDIPYIADQLPLSPPFASQLSPSPSLAMPSSPSFDDFGGFDGFSPTPQLDSIDNSDDPWGDSSIAPGTGGVEDDDDGWGAPVRAVGAAGDDADEWGALARDQEVKEEGGSEREGAEGAQGKVDEWEQARMIAAKRHARAPPYVLAGLERSWKDLASERYPDPSPPKPDGDNGAEIEVRTEVDSHLDRRLEDDPKITTSLDTLTSLPSSSSKPLKPLFSQTATERRFLSSLNRTTSLASSSNTSFLASVARRRPGLRSYDSSGLPSRSASTDDGGFGFPSGWADRSMLGEPGGTAEAEVKAGGEEMPARGGLLSFFGRKRSSMGPGVQINGTQHVVAASATAEGASAAISPTASLRSPTPSISTNPSSFPLPASTRTSIDVNRTSSPLPSSFDVPSSNPSNPFPTEVLSLPPPPSSPALEALEAASNAAPPSPSTAAAPSAVSRFLNRWSRKPAARASLDGKQELQLSSDDFSFLEEVEGADAGGGADADLDFFASGVPGGGSFAALSAGRKEVALPKPLAPPPAGAPAPTRARPASMMAPQNRPLPPSTSSASNEIDFLDFGGSFSPATAISPTTASSNFPSSSIPVLPPPSSSSQPAPALASNATAGFDDWDDFLTASAAPTAPKQPSANPPVAFSSPMAASTLTPFDLSSSASNLTPSSHQSQPSSSSFDDFGDFDSARILPSASSSSAFVDSSSFDDFGPITSSSSTPSHQPFPIDASFTSLASLQSTSSVSRLRETTSSSFTTPFPPTPPTKSPRHSQSIHRMPSPAPPPPPSPLHTWSMPNASSSSSTPAPISKPIVNAPRQTHQHHRTSSSIVLVEKGLAASGSVWPALPQPSSSSHSSNNSFSRPPTLTTTPTPFIAPLAPPPGGLGGKPRRGGFMDDDDDDEEHEDNKPLSTFTMPLARQPSAAPPLAAAPGAFDLISGSVTSISQQPTPTPPTMPKPTGGGAGGGTLSNADLSFFDSL